MVRAYSTGFLFSPGHRRVLLIRKNRPAWQAGKLNGIGGKVEPGETPLAAMIREFREEAGLDGLDWQEVAVLTGPGHRVHIFMAMSSTIDDAAQCTDEVLVWVPVLDLPRHPLIPNLRVLIPLAMDTTGIVKPVQFMDER